MLKWRATGDTGTPAPESEVSLVSEFSEGFRLGDELSKDQAEAMLKFYCKTLNELGYTAKPFADTGAKVAESIYSAGKFEVMNHALWMLDQIEAYLRQGRMAKAHRWIGMVQDILFMGGVFSIEELKKHNTVGPE